MPRLSAAVDRARLTVWPTSTARRVHDADAHIMEPPTWLRDHADPDIRDRIEIPTYANELAQTGDAAPGDAPDPAELDAIFARLADRHRSDEFLADRGDRRDEPQELRGDRRRSSPTTARGCSTTSASTASCCSTRSTTRRLYQWEHGDGDGVDLDLAYGAARAHNRGMTEFCSVDDRLLPTCYVPLADFDRADGDGDRGDRDGRRRAAVASGCPAGHSPSHRSARPRCGARPRRPASRSCSTSAAPATLIDPNYFHNGLPIPPDFHGGDENFRSVDYMAIPFPPMQTLATMIFDGVLDRHPTLRIGVIEQGCIWLPSWLKQMESAMDAFGRHEERLRAAVAHAARVRRAPGAGHAVPDRGRRLGHRPGRPEHLAVQHRLPPRRRRAATLRAFRDAASATGPRRSVTASTPTTSST